MRSQSDMAIIYTIHETISTQQRVGKNHNIYQRSIEDRTDYIVSGYFDCHLVAMLQEVISNMEHGRSSTCWPVHNGFIHLQILRGVDWQRNFGKDIIKEALAIVCIHRFLGIQPAARVTKDIIWHIVMNDSFPS